jgi:glycosyltransferase involved in cell wall biosynthesis
MPSDAALAAYDAFRKQVRANPSLADAWGATGPAPARTPPPGAVLTILERRGVGASNIAFHVIEGLRDRGIPQVTLGHGDPGSIAGLASYHTFDAALAVPAARASWRALRRRLEDLIEAHAPRVVVTHREFPWAWILAEIADAGGAPRAVVACNGGPLLYRVAGTPLEPELGAALSRADAVVALSQHVRHELVDRVGVPSERIVIARGGYDPALFHPRQRVPARGRLRVAYVGRLEPDKAPDRFLDAVRRATRAGASLEATVVGDGAMRPALEALAHGLPVRFVGSVAAAAVGEILRETDVLLVPSRHEGLGLQTIEALACGVAVVASRVGGLCELIGESGAGRLVETRAQMATALGALSADAGALRALQVAGPAYLSATDMTWPAVVDRWARTLDQVLD